MDQTTQPTAQHTAVKQVVPQKPRVVTEKSTPAHVAPGQIPKKKSKWWVWLIVAIVVLGLAGGAYWYFLMK